MLIVKLNNLNSSQQIKIFMQDVM